MPSLGAALFLSYAPNDSAWHGSLVAQVLTLPSLGSHMGGHMFLWFSLSHVASQLLALLQPGEV